MADRPKLDTWTDYQSAWSDIPDGERRALLAKSVTDDCHYSDPVSSHDGIDALIDHIHASQRKWPGAHFRNDRFLEHHDQALSEWTMFDGTGGVVATGVSYARFGADGRLTQMTGFFEAKQP